MEEIAIDRMAESIDDDRGNQKRHEEVEVLVEKPHRQRAADGAAYARGLGGRHSNSVSGAREIRIVADVSRDEGAWQ
jgi:hypothetical protein